MRSNNSSSKVTRTGKNVCELSGGDGQEEMGTSSVPIEDILESIGEVGPRWTGMMCRRIR